MSVLLVILTITFLLYLWSRRRYYILSWQLKGPLGLPFLGSLESLNPKHVLSLFTNISKTYKTPTTFWLGPICFLYLDDPETIERVLNAPECINKSIIYDPVTRLGGEGLLSSSNPKWGVHRKLLNPLFKTRNLMSFFPIFNTEASVFTAKLKKHVDADDPINIKDCVERFTLNIASQTFMETKVNFQSDDYNSIFESLNSLKISTAKQMMNIFYRFDWFGKIFDFKFFKDKYKAWEHITYFVKMGVFAKLYDKETRGNSLNAKNNINFIKSEYSFVNHVTDLYLNQLFSMDDVMSESLHLLAAAYETTANTLHNIIIFLAINPEWQEKLFEEVKEVFPDKDSDVFFENLKDVPLAEMIINETLRLLPTVPIQGRQTNTDFQLNDNILIPKGTNIVFDTYSLHRNPKYWGTDALEFNPYRFLPDAVKERHPYTFMPFSKGLRHCLGWRFAYLSLNVFLIKTCRNFRFTTTSKLEEIEIYFNIVAQLKVTPKIKVHARLK